eukprot:6021074-Pleurochrysis_carterae.AAC.2
MLAVVEAPHARRAVDRARDYVLAVGSHAHRVNPSAVTLERAHLRAHSGSGYSRVRSLVSQADSIANRLQGSQVTQQLQGSVLSESEGSKANQKIRKFGRSEMEPDRDEGKR